MKRLGLIFLTFTAVNGYTQTAFDGLRFSRNELSGTSRYVSMGGAFTALGGDATASLYNPAGLGVLRNNEFSTSLAYHQNSTTSNYYQNQVFSSTGNLSIPSFQIAGVSDLHGPNKWKSQAFSIGTNHVFDYNESYNVIGSQVPESKLDYYTQFLNTNKIDYSAFGGSVPSYPFDLYLAWYQYLVDTIPGQSNQYFNRSGVLPVDQEYKVVSSGRKNQIYGNLAGNYDDKLYVGAGAQISSVRFSQKQSYSEYIDQSDTTTNLNYFNEVFNETVKGWGLSFNAGIIYRITDALRLGLSLNSPEFLMLTSTFDSQNTTDYSGNSDTEASPVQSSYKYNVNTPAKASLGMAYVIGKRALVSTDIDVLDYSSIHLRGRLDGDPFTSENTEIKTLLGFSVNYRAGAEYRITDFIAARAGFSYYDNPYKLSSNGRNDYTIYSFGGGYRNSQYFIDAAISNRLSNDKFHVFPSQKIDPALITSNDLRIQVTCGLKF